MLKTKKLAILLAMTMAGAYSANAAATFGGGGSYGSGGYSWNEGGNDHCSYNCDSSGNSKGDGSEYSYSYDKDSAGSYQHEVKVSAWSNTKTDKKLDKKEIYYNATEKHYGVDNNEDDNDNGEKYFVDNDGYMDSILYDFEGKCVVLDSIIIDYDGYSSDSDVKIMAFVGDEEKIKKDGGYASFGDYLNDHSYEDFDTGGSEDGNWKKYQANNVKDYNNRYDSDGDNNSYRDSYKKDFVGYTKDKNGNDVKDYTASSYWLVMADGKADNNKDYFKIKDMGGYDYDKNSGGCKKVEIVCEDKPNTPTGQVPLPGTTALLGLGLTLLGYTRRRKN